MDFTVDIMEFPSEVHRVIYCGAREMTRPEKSLSDMEDSVIKASCEAYYAFLMELYSDMYEHPVEYGMPVYALETFLGDKNLNRMKQKYPSKTKSLIAITRNCAERYLQTLCRMAYLGTLNGEHLFLSQENLAAIENAVNTLTSPVSLKRRLAALERAGFLEDANGFFCVNHPNLFPAMIALAKKTNGTFSGLNFYLFTKTDFRNITHVYKPTAEDYIAPLPKALKETAMAIHGLAVSLGCKENITTFLKINYKYKGKEVLLIDTYGGTLNVRVTGVYAWEDRAFFMERLLAQPEERQRYANRHLWRCSACSTTHLGQKIEFLGRTNRVCGGGQIGFTWRNPKADDLPELEFLMKTRCEMTACQKSSKSKHGDT